MKKCGARYLKGSGLGKHFQRLKDWFMPIFRKSIMPGLKTIGKEAKGSVFNIAADMIDGRSLESASTEHFNKSIQNLKEAAALEMSGSGNKRPKSKNLQL